MAVAELLILGLLVSGFQRSTTRAEVYTCQLRNPCVLHHVNLTTEQELNEAEFPDTTDPLLIDSGNIPHFTRQLAEKISHIVDLTVRNAQMKTFYVRPNLTHLDAVDNELNTLLVDNDQRQNYELISLNLTNNKLTDVTIVSRFAKLRVLALDGNDLKELQMDLFAELTELRFLSLARNQLQTIETNSGVHLVKLRSLSFGGNRLMELDVQKWELDSLKQLDLSDNHMYLLNGNLEKFKSLEKVYLARNNWKCDCWMNISRLSNVEFDKDEPGRCGPAGLTEIGEICCTVDASNILGTTNEFEIFHEKWAELGKLHKLVVELNESVVEIKETTSNSSTDKEEEIERRLEKLESAYEELEKKLEDQRASEALEETNELREILTNHKETIDGLESKHSDLTEELERFVESLNSIRETVNEKMDTIETVNKKVEVLEETLQNENSKESINGTLTKLATSFKQLESQHLKYHLSSIDLKSQISYERSRINDLQGQFSKVTREAELLRDQMSEIQKTVNIVMHLLDELSTVDD